MSTLDPKTVKIDDIWICTILPEIYLVKIQQEHEVVYLDPKQSKSMKYRFAGFYRKVFLVKIQQKELHMILWSKPLGSLTEM